MGNYTIILPNEKAATYRAVTFIIACINLIAFCYLYIKSTNEMGAMLASIGAILFVFTLILLTFFSSKKQAFYISMAFVCAGLIWLYVGLYLIGILVLLFSLFGFFTTQTFKIVVSDKGILYPSFPSVQIRWEEVAQAILKDNILTIDLKNNKLYQFVVPEKDNHIIESDFNLFCLSHKK